MKGQVVTAVVGIAFCFSANAYDFEAPSETVWGNKESQAVSMASNWIRSSTEPFQGEDGRIMHTFGMGQPAIVCSQSFPCDIQLQKGEKFHDAFMGKRSQWLVEAAVSGRGRYHQVHLIVSPRSNTYRGSVAMLIYTDRRTYRIKVTARPGEGSHAIGFVYPDERQHSSLSRLREYQETVLSPAKEESGVKRSRKYAAYPFNIQSGYEIKGSASWKPRSVYEDGRQTFIEFPEGVLDRGAPALLVIDEASKSFAVTSRRVANKIVVDTVIEKAVLKKGRAKVDIEKRGNKWEISHEEFGQE